MKFGIGFTNSGAFSNPALMGHLATTAERCGFESLWTVEHVAVPVKHLPYPGTKDGQMPGGDDVPIQDPLIPLCICRSNHENDQACDRNIDPAAAASNLHRERGCDGRRAIGWARDAWDRERMDEGGIRGARDRFPPSRRDDR